MRNVALAMQHNIMEVLCYTDLNLYRFVKEHNDFAGKVNYSYVL